MDNRFKIAALTLALAALPAAAQSQREQNARAAYRVEAAVQDMQRLREQFDILVQNQDTLDARLANLEKARGDTANLQAQIDEIRRAQESLREAISALSRSMQAQRREIVEEITRKVEALYRSNPPPAASSGRGRSQTPAAHSKPPRAVASEGYEHVVAAGQTLSTIAREYGCCTVQDILDANPNLKPNKMKVGQKIFVPDMGTAKDGRKQRKR